ncbi:MAG: hypothetical protein D6798_09795 [Deltaproteobacteria bacterium]|nr:MAG: hypothetical protein D6798_09795 [Deltaproteobacteria bacterium]
MIAFLLACIGPSGLPDSGPPDSGSLSVLTYNVHGLPEAVTGDDTPARMAAIAPLLPAFQLVGIQEDWDATNHEILVAEAPHPIQEWFDDKLDDSRLYGAGLSLLAPGTERMLHEQHYSRCNGVLDGASDCLASKGFQVLRLDLGGVQLDVYNTHLEAGRGEEDGEARASNVAELLAAMDELSTDRAVIAMGDTNLHGDDPEDQPLIQQLVDAGLRNACDEVGCPEPDRIDRIMVRDGGDVALAVDSWAVPSGFEDADGVPLSDHDPIAVVLSWTVQ